MTSASAPGIPLPASVTVGSVASSELGEPLELTEPLELVEPTRSVEPPDPELAEPVAS
jgi:hypothetical protein